MTATPVHFLANHWVIAHAAIVTTPAPGIRVHRHLRCPSPRARQLHRVPTPKVFGPPLPHHDDCIEQPVLNAVGSIGLMVAVVLLALLACGFRP